MENADLDLAGIREGDDGALTRAAQRRGPSVIAYCNQVCGPGNGEIAAAEAFARMRSIACAHEGETALDGDELLRRATRHAAAGIAREPQGPPPTGAIPGRGTMSCLDVAILLAAAGDGAVSPEQRQRLRAHIDDCDRCSALAEITRRADTAYGDPPNDRIGSRLTDRLVAVMSGVTGGVLATAPPPVSTTSVAPLYPHLPELADEIPIGEQAAPVVQETDLPELVAPTPGKRWSRLLRPRRTTAPAPPDAVPAPQSVEMPPSLPVPVPQQTGDQIAA